MSRPDHPQLGSTLRSKGYYPSKRQRDNSFRSLLADLATMARNTITTAIAPRWPLTVLTRPTAVQRRAFALLDVAV